MAARLTNIYIYPIKSLGGVELETAEIDGRGFKSDRKWMLVDEEGVFLSQRKYPKMALLKVTLEEDRLKVYNRHADGGMIEISHAMSGGDRIRVSIWNDMCDAETADKRTNEWFSDTLGINCRLVKMPEDEKRYVDARFSTKGETVNFPDSFPFLLIGKGSLDLLNEKLEKPIAMDRFRPNLVTEGFAPFEEDTWATFQIGKTVFRAAKPCARCTVTTVDQQTGETGKEPLKTLAKFRKRDNKILFGQNLLCVKGSGVSVGEEVKILN